MHGRFHLFQKGKPVRDESLVGLAKGRNFYVIGLGCVAQASLPLMFNTLGLHPGQVTLFAPQAESTLTDGRYGRYECAHITENNYQVLVGRHLKPGDVVLNVANEVSTVDTIQMTQAAGALYLDAGIEPWANWYDNPDLHPSERSNYALRKAVLAHRGAGRATAVITHGANPGLVSHFAKRAIWQVAQQLGTSATRPTSRQEWAALAAAIGLRTLFVAEYDSQQTSRPRTPNAFFNTWSVMGFIAEAGQPAELGWGTHEKRLPLDGARHSDGGPAIYLSTPGAAVRVKSWIPGLGTYHGFLITHGEAISLADYLSCHDTEGALCYRPTVFYAYRPCDAAIASLHDLSGRQWDLKACQMQVLTADQLHGEDTLGVLLGCGHGGCYWYGSQLSTLEARALCPGASATSLQVGAGVLGGLVWAMENPDRGLVEPEDMDSERVLEIASPYLGKLFGEFSDWTPLASVNPMFPEVLDLHDPWQFDNIRVK